MKIDNDTSQRIYQLATDTHRKTSNREIGEMFGITETAVRQHVQKWEKKLHEIGKSYDKAAAVTDHFIDVRADLKQAVNKVKDQIQQAIK